MGSAGAGTIRSDIDARSPVGRRCWLPVIGRDSQPGRYIKSARGFSLIALEVRRSCNKALAGSALASFVQAAG
jgi:hypothetical protein